MTTATLSHYWRCLAELQGGVCGQVFYDQTDRAPCPNCGNSTDTHLEAVELEELEAEEQATEPAAVPQPKAKHKPQPAVAKPKLAGRQSKPSAVIQRATLERSRTGVERISAWGVLLLSVLGTVVAFHGGWDAFLAQRNPIAIGGGVALQIGLTYVQWAYYRQRVLALGSRLVDAALTALGYGPLFLVPLTGAFASIGVTSVIAGQPGALVAAWAAIGIASYGLAWYPESRLVN